MRRLDLPIRRARATVGTDAGPLFSLKDPSSGKVTGFDAGLSQMLARYIIGDAKTQLTITSVDTRETLLQTSVNTVQDLAGKTVATEANSTAVLALQKAVPSAKPLLFQEDAQCVAALQQGRPTPTSSTRALVILPQAIRLVVPTLVTQLVALLKDSTLGYVVSYPELMKQGNNLTVYTHLLVQTYLVVAAIYVVANLLLSRLATYLESRMGTRARGRVAAAPDEAPATMV